MKRRDFIKLGLAAPLFWQLACSDKNNVDLINKGTSKAFDFIELKGSYRDIGIGIGKRTEATITAVLNERKGWFNKLSEVVSSSEGKMYSNKLFDITKKVFPQYIEELEGMAEGSDIDFDTIWIMTIQNELSSKFNLLNGSSTIFYKDNERTWLFHNEDGEKTYNNRMLMIKAAPPSGISFYTLAYPGVISGIGPSMNNRGVCQTTNFISSTKPETGIPGYILCRAALESKNIPEAIQIVSSDQRAYPLHHNFLSCKQRSYASIETLPNGKLSGSYPDDGLYIHTNHAQGKNTQDYDYQDLNYRNTSSMSRFQALTELISLIDLPTNNPEKFIRLLSSHKNKPYSPCRHAEGGLNCQTLATAFFDAENKKMRIYKGNPCDAIGDENYSEYSF